jgi:hypothetical protein
MNPPRSETTIPVVGHARHKHLLCALCDYGLGSALVGDSFVPLEAQSLAGRITRDKVSVATALVRVILSPFQHVSCHVYRKSTFRPPSRQVCFCRIIDRIKQRRLTVMTVNIPLLSKSESGAGVPVRFRLTLLIALPHNRP